MEEDESPIDSARREVFEETHLKVRGLFYHGTILYFMNGKSRVHTKAHLFSTRQFFGRPTSTKEGQLRWFRVDKLPFEKMWDDDKYWINLMLIRSRFNAEFYFDQRNRTVIRYKIVSR